MTDIRDAVNTLPTVVRDPVVGVIRPRNAIAVLLDQRQLFWPAHCLT